MTPTAAVLVCLAALAMPAPVLPQVLFVKVGPSPVVAGRTADQSRAVVLIHGLSINLLNPDKVTNAGLRAWQQPDHDLVRKLSRDADVYGLAYSQNVPAHEIAHSADVLAHLRSLKEAGYRDVVLVGHSAGGLIARHVVEDNPDLGVTRVIQVCAPNVGSNWAVLRTARAAQIPFLLSLTPGNRLKLLEERIEKKIPDKIAFICVVGSSHLKGDGIVFCRSQWSQELQAQGVPAYSLRTSHRDAMHNPKTAELLEKLVVEPAPRWDNQKVTEVRKQLLGN